MATTAPALPDPSTAAYPSPSGALLSWPDSLAEWTRAAQSWSLEGTDAADASDEVCTLLREVQCRLRSGSLEALLSWWPACGRLLRALAVHPLLLLGDAGGLIVASAVRAMRRFSPAGAPTSSSRDACRRYSDWCAQFLRHLSGGMVLPIDSTDELLKTLEVGADDSRRAQMEDAVAAAVGAVRARGVGSSRSAAVPACRECAQEKDGPVDEPAPAVDAHAPAQAGDFARRCGRVLARALHENKTTPGAGLSAAPAAGGAGGTPAGVLAGGLAGGAAGASPSSSLRIPPPPASDDWSSVSPLVVELISHAPNAVSHSLAQAVAEAHARAALRVPAAVVCHALALHPALWADQISALLTELHQRCGAILGGAILGGARSRAGA